VRRRIPWIVGCALLALAAPLAAVPGHHPDPHALPVPFDGEPWYIEYARGPDGVPNGTVGTQVSDFGSHSGIKATLLDDRPLLAANYTDGTGFGEKIDRTYFNLESPNGESFEPADRRVRFSRSSWDETGTLASPAGERLDVQGFATGIATDVFLMDLRIRNAGPTGVEFVPSFAVESTANSREFTESSHPFPSEGTSTVVPGFEGVPRVAIAKTLGETTISGARAAATAFRVIAPSFGIEAVDEVHRLDDYSITIRGENSVIAPDAEVDVFAVVSFAESAATADDLASAGFDLVGGQPAVARARVLADWERFEASLPVPNVTGDRARALFLASHAGLRMNLYAPRASMPYWGSLPGKAHFNFFWAWDTGIHALGQTAWSTWNPSWRGFDPNSGTMAEQQLSTLFRAQLADGAVPMIADENEVPALPVYSQPPVQGWAIREAYESDPDRARARQWLERMYEASRRYLAWWETRRDTDRDGLAEYLSGAETGWDDTPRYVGSEGSVAGTAPVANEDAVDLQAWLVQYFDVMAWAGEELQKGPEIEAWRQKANALAVLVEDRMWNEERGAWQDILLGPGGHEFADVATPAMWWPAFAGLSRDESRVRRVIEQTLLDPNRFFGEFPIPTVAYNDGNYGDGSDGFYWRGQIWMVPAYVALQTLATYGYESEAEALRARLLDMMAGKGGPYETYDARTGQVGWGSGGVGEPSVHLIGLSTALTSEMLLSRYDRQRLLFAGARGFRGYVRDASWLSDRAPAFQIESGGYEVPLVDVETLRGESLRLADEIAVRITDPSGNLSLNVSREISVRFPSLDGFDVFVVGHGGERSDVPLGVGPGTAFRAVLTQPPSDVAQYLLVRRK